MMRTIYNYFLVFSFVGSFGLIMSCEDEIEGNMDQAYITTSDSLTTSIEKSVDSIERKGEELEDAIEELSQSFDNEI